MSCTAVVTGSAARVDDVARAIARRGIDVLPMVRGDGMCELGAEVADGSVDYYVQLQATCPHRARPTPAPWHHCSVRA